MGGLRSGRSTPDLRRGGRIRLYITLMLVALVVAGACCYGVATALWQLVPKPCRPPYDESALIAAYRADPMLADTVDTASARVVHYCDPTVDTGPAKKTMLFVYRPVPAWESSDQLAT